jgi:hypothetical protein
MCFVIPGRAVARTWNLALIISGFRACLLRRHPGMTTAKQIRTIPLRGKHGIAVVAGFVVLSKSAAFVNTVASHGDGAQDDA